MEYFTHLWTGTPQYQFPSELLELSMTKLFLIGSIEKKSKHEKCFDFFKCLCSAVIAYHQVNHMLVCFGPLKNSQCFGFISALHVGKHVLHSFVRTRERTVFFPGSIVKEKVKIQFCYRIGDKFSDSDNYHHFRTRYSIMLQCFNNPWLFFQNILHLKVLSRSPRRRNFFCNQ